METDNCKIFQDLEKNSANKNLKENTGENTTNDLKQKKNEVIFVDSPKKTLENHKGDNKDNVTNENDRNYSLERDQPFEKSNENQFNYFNENQIYEQYKNYDLQDHFYIYCNCNEEQLNSEEIRVVDILSRHAQLDLKKLQRKNNSRVFNENLTFIRCQKCESPRDYSKMSNLINCIKKDEKKNHKKNRNHENNKQKKNRDKKKLKKKKENNEKEFVAVEEDKLNAKETELIISNVNDNQSNVDDSQLPAKDDESEEISQTETKPKKKYVINKPKRKYFCEKCGSKFTSSYGMKYHNDKVHTTEKDLVIKPFPCPIDNCLKRYKNNNGLKYHLNNQHSTS